MENSFLSAGSFHHLTGAFFVNTAIFIQKAEDQAVSSMFNKEFGIFQHGLKLSLSIIKAGAPRPDHDADRQADLAFGFQECSQRRRQAAQFQGVVQFNSVSPQLFCQQAVVDAAAANFNRNVFFHKDLLP